MAILTGTTNNDEIGGTLQSDLILALAGNDVVIGAGGADIIDGGSGDDILYASNLSNYDDGAVDTLTGGAGNDTIYAQAGDNVDGGTGSRDTLYLDLSSADEGVSADFREMTVGIDLGLGGLTRIELPLFNATLGNFEVVAGVIGSAFADEFFVSNLGKVATSIDGGGGDDTVRTSGGDDLISGGNGVDRLNSGGGQDTVDGGAGNDVIIGGLGQDILTGGTGADRFVYDMGDSGAGRNSADRITDFSRAEGDKIALGALDAIAGTPENDTFSWIGSDRFTGVAGELRFQVMDGNTFVSADFDGDRQSDFVIQLDGVVNNLTASDFVL